MRRTFPTRLARPWLVAAVAISALGAVASSAQASSIFFVRSNDIWVSNPNGSGARQVTTDGGNGQPYVWVAASKGASARLAYLRTTNGGTPRLLVGTMNPDGSGSAINAANATMQPQGLTDGKMVSIDNAGDRVAWPKSYLDNFVFPAITDFAAYSTGVDGINEQHLVTSQATNVTFGDPAGQSLLFNDVGIGSTFGAMPAGCQRTTLRYVIVRQAPAPTGGTPGAPSVYCVPGLDLVDPALRPDGQVIAAVRSDIGNAGTDSIVTMPISGVATNSAATPVTQVTSPGTASVPDFSPDGTQIAFVGAGNTIDTVPSAGGAPTQILTDASSPAWSPYTLPGSAAGSNRAPSATKPSSSTPATGGSVKSAARCTVPRVKGDTLVQARRAVTRAGCRVGHQRKAFSRTVKRGRIMAQFPRARSIVAAGTAVALTMSEGTKHRRHR